MIMYYMEPGNPFATVTGPPLPAIINEITGTLKKNKNDIRMGKMLTER